MDVYFFSFIFSSIITQVISLIINLFGLVDQSIAEDSRFMTLIFILLVFFTLFIVYPIYTYFSSHNERYFLTNKRIILKSGIFRNKFESYELSTITDISVDEGLGDKYFGKNSASISLEHRDQENKESQDKYEILLVSINDPKNVLEIFKKVVSDIKAIEK